MNSIPIFVNSCSIPLYRQFADYVRSGIRNGDFEPDKALPSIRAMMIATGLSRETVIKGYSYLCREGVIVSRHGLGYFVKQSFLTGSRSVIIFLDKMSQHQQDILDGFIETVNEKVDITIRMHYQNPKWLEEEIDKALDRFDYYLLFPHFAQDDMTKEVVKGLIRKFPVDKLIVLDRLGDMDSEVSGASYQSIEDDVPSALEKVIDDIRKYRRMRFLSLSVSLYGGLVADVLKKFGADHGVEVEILKEIPAQVCKGDLFFVSGSRLDKNLSKLLKIMVMSGCEVGKDVGLICYNDFPLNEYILGGLTTLTTDFVRMGRTAGDMVLGGNLSKIRCPGTLIRRKTF